MHPSMYLIIAVARMVTSHQAIAEIAGGAPLHPDELSQRISLAISRGGAMMVLSHDFADKLCPRLEAALARKVSHGQALGLLQHPLLSFRGLNFDAFVARAHQHIVRLLGMSNAELIALLLAAESTPVTRR